MAEHKIPVTIKVKSYFFVTIKDACNKRRTKVSALIRSAIEYALENKIDFKKYIETEKWLNTGTYDMSIVGKVDRDTVRKFDEYMSSQGINDRSLAVRCALIAYLKIGEDKQTYKAKVEKIKF